MNLDMMEGLLDRAGPEPLINQSCTRQATFRDTSGYTVVTMKEANRATGRGRHVWDRSTTLLLAPSLLPSETKTDQVSSVIRRIELLQAAAKHE